MPGSVVKRSVQVVASFEIYGCLIAVSTVANSEDWYKVKNSNMSVSSAACMS